MSSYWAGASLNGPVDTVSATKGRAASSALSAVHIPVISGCGSMLSFTALRTWNGRANKDGLDCQSEAISKEIPSVTTTHTHTHTHTAQDTLMEDVEWAGGWSPWVDGSCGRDPKMIWSRRWNAVTEMDRVLAAIASDHFGGLRLYEFHTSLQDRTMDFGFVCIEEDALHSLW